jgi:hypothetical protein
MNISVLLIVLFTACTNAAEKPDLVPLKRHSSFSYAPLPVIGELLIDPGMKELYWDKKHGFERDKKKPSVILRYIDTVTIAQTTFYKPRVYNDVDVPEISFILNRMVGRIEDHICAGDKGTVDVSTEPGDYFKSKVSYHYHKNTSAMFSRFFHAIFWLPRKGFEYLLNPKIMVYDEFVLITTDRKYENCRIFVYPSSFYILCRGRGLIAFGSNNPKENYYYILETDATRLKEERKRVKPSAPRRRPSWRRKR